MNVLIHDSTLRDGNHAAKHKLSIGVIETHCNLANRAGINSVEVGHGNGLGASSFQVGISPYSDKEMIMVAKKFLTKTKLAVHVMPGFATFERDIKPAIDLGVDIFRVGTHCTESNLATSFIEKLASLNIEVLSCLMMSHMAEPEKLLAEAKYLENLGANGICIYDSAGSFDIERTEETITTLVNNLTIPVGFHGHNNLGLAVANSYVALQKGAKILDASICSYGAGAGNTQLEVLASLLESKSYNTGINLSKLYDLVTYASSTYAINKPFPSTLSIVSGISGVFSGFANHVLKASAIYNVDSIDLFKKLGEDGIVGGQEDQIYSVASIMASKTNANHEKENTPRFINLNFIDKKSSPRKVSNLEFEERKKYSLFARLDEENQTANDPLMHTLLENVRHQGKLYFDGPRSLGYGGYKSVKDYWKSIANELIDKFNFSTNDTILDIGCAKGYMVQELTKRGYPKTYGIDISEYAINSSPSSISEKLINASVVKIPFPTNFFDFSLCIDVLQEIPKELIPASIREISRVSKNSLVVVPAIKDNSLKSKNEFLSWSITAINAKTSEQWEELFKTSGYTNYYSVFNIDLKIE